MSQQSVTCRVHGRVQGVGFRFSVWQYATREHLTGYVRNLNDGTVEVAARGDTPQITALIHWLRAGGPQFARVDDVFVNTPVPEPEWGDFSIKY